MKTVVGMYNSMDQANQVKSTLTSQGYDSNQITVIDQSGEGYNAGSYGNSSYGSGDAGSSYGSGSSSYGSGSTTTASGYDTTDADHNTVGGRIKHFFSSLSGHDETVHNSYTQGVSNGGAIVAVTVEDSRADDVADLLQQNGASDIEGAYGATGYGNGYGANDDTLPTDAGDRNFGTGTGTLSGSATGGTLGNTGDFAGTGRTGSGYAAGTDTANLSGEQVIPVVEENLTVGKRQVQRGGVRIYSRVVEQPVSESVNLHDERIVVDRRPVDRAATDADFNTGSGVVELTATGEEAVVGKRSRVVEEVLVGKEGSDRTEEITDTVRHTEVNVEQVPGETSTVGTTGNTTTNRR